MSRAPAESSDRSLTARSAAACENAKSPRSACRCRCGGACHGIARGAVRDLPAGDPHHPDDESPKERKQRERRESDQRFREMIKSSMKGDD